MRLSALRRYYSISLPAISLGDWFCMSRKCGTGGGGLVHPEGEYSMAMFGFGSISLTLPYTGAKLQKLEQ